MNAPDYKSLLEKRNFINWLRNISLYESDDNASIKQAANQLLSLIEGDYPIPATPFYEGLYLKYKFKLFSTKTDSGEKNVLYSYDGQNLKAVGIIQKQTSKRILPNPIVTASVTPTPSITVTPTVTPTPSVTPSVTPTVTVTPSVTLTPTPSVTPSGV